MADKPKRPLSAYMIWLNDHREQIKKENPGIKVTEIAKRGGELWRALKDKSVSIFFVVVVLVNLKGPNCNRIFSLFDHQEWDQKAVEAKERYTKLIKEFEANGGSKDAPPAGRKRTKGAKKPAVKKSKKKAESEDEEASEDESD